jgi:hypothetical protein
MNENRIQELSKNRDEQINMAEICNSAVIGIFALWVIWVSTSLLIHFIR